MKPVYLEFCGVNSFSEKAQIDFRKLLSGGLFGIFGDTGSGKSTILDSIHFALYGKVERAGSGTDCINYNCDKASVIFDFEIMIKGVRHTYRVQRERRRKNNIAKAYLYEYNEEGALLALAEKTNDVDDALQEIIGLEFDDFKKCIALPQGEFAGLVKSTAKERVTLVSRLFNLEKYGDRLGIAIRRKCDEITQETAVLEAKMQENEGGREEFIAQKAMETELLKKQKAETDKAFLRAEQTLSCLEKTQEEKKKYDALCAELALAQGKYEEYIEKQRQLQRAESANTVLALSQTVEKTQAEEKTAKVALDVAQAGVKTAEKRIRETDAFIAESRFDERIEKLTADIAVLTATQAQIQECEKAKIKLDECLKNYAKFKEAAKREGIIAEAFDELLGEVEEKIAGVGEDESFTEFLKRSFKDVLLSETYGNVRTDLTFLGEKYPQAQEDIRILKEKYTFAKMGSEKSFDVAKAKIEFDKAEELRKKLKAQKDAIEKRKKRYEEYQEQEKRIVEDGKRYRALYNEAEEKIAFVKDMGSVDELTARRESLRKDKAAAEEEKRLAQTSKSNFEADVKAQTALLSTYQKQAEGERAKLQEALDGYRFDGLDSVKSVLQKVGDIAAAKDDCEKFFEKYTLLKTQREQAYDEKFEQFDAQALEKARAEKQALGLLKDKLSAEIAVSEDNLKSLQETRQRYLMYQAELAEKQKSKGLWEQLKSLVRGSQFMEYIASEYLQEICLSASRTLNSLTNGRYFLRYDKEFKAGDNLNGGELRAVKTLSGGETFLVSLSLALALSNAIFAKSLRPIEFFFLDEGFGTLDATLVDTVMDVLGRLSKDFAVGLISHVDELKHRIENKIIVTGANEKHGSRLKMETY